MTGSENKKKNYTLAEDGTVYWTVSFYIPSDKVSVALGLIPDSMSKAGSAPDANTDFKKAKRIVIPDQWRKLVLDHRCSLVLGEAIDPLFNDIADRDIQGNAQEFLISALKDPIQPSQGGFPSEEEIDKAHDAVLESAKIKFHPPKSVSWVTEGKQYKATPPELQTPRLLTLKRFWLAHYGGALSYHLSFRYKYSKPTETDKGTPPAVDDYCPATYYFISMLQKLVAPKEFQLALDKRFGLAKTGSSTYSIFDPGTCIGLLDEPIVENLSPKKIGLTRFWEGIEDLFEEDAQQLLELAKINHPNDFSIIKTGKNWRESLLPDQPVIEVPGLGMPRCRFMFFFHDKRFFDLLMPADNDGNTIDRRPKVKNDQYQLNLDEIKALQGTPIELGNKYWQWIKTQNKDLLDYLFLSGFNQNIIDFMSQDESEILDSTDPLYPDSKDSAKERFFVRFANHRALTTYVPASRSLEIGNDYIGTCPYAFLIHALSIHNEYLDRLHEEATTDRLKLIENEIDKIEIHIKELNFEKNKDSATSNSNLKQNRGKEAGVDIETLSEKLNNVESVINGAKIAHYQEYLRYRYKNPFRYDTEYEVFEKLEAIRGKNRKPETLAKAVENIEDQARDLSLQNKELTHSIKKKREDEEARQKELDSAIEKERENKEARQREQMNLGLSTLGFFGLMQVLYGLVSTRLQPNEATGKYIVLSSPKLAAFAEIMLAALSALLTVLFILWFYGTVASPSTAAKLKLTLKKLLDSRITIIIALGLVLTLGLVFWDTIGKS